MAAEIVERERKHAVKARDDAAAPFRVAVKNHFAVAVRLEHVAAAAELLTKGSIVVDLTVYDESKLTVLTHERLPAIFGKVDDGEASVPKRAGAPAPCALRVRTSVGQTCIDGPYEWDGRRCRSIGFEDASNAAHDGTMLYHASRAIRSVVSAADPNLRTWKRAALLLPAQVFARGLEALLPIAMAAWFGRSAATDAYWASYALFLFALSLVASAFQDSALVPVLTELLATDLPEHRRTTRSLVGSASVMGVLVGIVFVSLASGYFAFLAPSEARAPGLLLWPFAALAPAIALRSLFAGMLQARGTLQVAPLTAGAGAVVQLGVLFALKARLGISVVPFAQLAAEVVNAAGMAVALRGDDRFSLSPAFTRTAASVRIFRLIFSQVLGTAVTRANPIVDQSFAFRAGVTGAVTALRYSVDVATAPTMLLEATLFQVIFVDLSRAAAVKDWERFRAQITKGILQVSGVIVLTSIALALLRRPIMHFVFAHGEMDQGGVDLLVQLLPWALIDAIPFAVLLILVRANVALQNTHIMLPLGILNVGLNAGLNALLLRPFGLGGLLAATAGTQAIIAILLFVSLQRSLRSKIQRGVLSDK